MVNLRRRRGAAAPPFLKDPDKRTYVLAYDEYMGVTPYMTQFDGTYRQLLEHLAGDEGDELRHLSDEELLKAIKDGNGDGQQYVQVWCVEDRKQVL